MSVFTHLSIHFPFNYILSRDAGIQLFMSAIAGHELLEWWATARATRRNRRRKRGGGGGGAEGTIAPPLLNVWGLSPLTFITEYE